ncbi:hypothetical protein FB45DRAFT_890731, partial [Roridomyces roridus]
IFVACLPTGRNAVMSALEAPLLVSRICSEWRAIALTTPSLWDSLHVPADFILKRPEQRIPAIPRWLQLSGALPLSLSFEFLDTSRPRTFEDFETLCVLIDRLVESTSRWERIVFRNFATTVPSGFANAEASLLKSFTGEGVTISVLRQLDGLLRTSSLRTLILHMDTLQPALGASSLLDLPCHWANLTHITLKPSQSHGGLPPGGVVTLLERCPWLVSFHVKANDTQNWDQYARPKQIPLPSLESLILFEPQALDLQSVIHLLDALCAPKLHQLHIPTNPLLAELHRWQCQFMLNLGTPSPLEDLLISLPSYTASMILETLGFLSNLTTLAILTRTEWGWGWGPGPVSNDKIESCSPERLLELLTPSPRMGICLSCRVSSSANVVPSSEKRWNSLFGDGLIFKSGSDAWLFSVMGRTGSCRRSSRLTR